MGKLYVLIGLPAAGKDYWIEHNKSKEDIVISSDTIREEVFGDVNNQDHNGEVFDIMFSRTREALANGKNVYYNATNINRKRRINFLKNFKNYEKIAIVMCVPIEICHRRNEKRERVVPYSVIERMYKNFQPPSIYEGFNSIRYIPYLSKNNSYCDDLLSENIACPHDNPHHRLSCGEHCLQTEKEMMNIFCDELYPIDKNLLMAARYHDLSKFRCKTFCKLNGELDSIAHYYFHENCSSYDFLCGYSSKLSSDGLDLISNLIANHMVFFSGEQAIAARKKIYSDNFWKKLELLHKADVAAH